MSFWRTMFFDEIGLHGQRSWQSALFALAVAAAVLAFPVNQALKTDVFLTQAALAAFALAAVVLLCFALARALGSQASVEWFFKTTTTVAALGLSISFILGWISIFLAQAMNNQLIAKAAFAVFPFYAFALFGWGVEKSAHLHDSRGFTLAALSIALFVLLHFGLEGLVA